jgi:cell division protease FtsH
VPAAEATTREIDIAVGDLIGKAFDRADQILQVRRADLDAGAKLLLKRETLTAMISLPFAPQESPASRGYRLFH